MSFGRNLRAAREKIGMTQDELAKKVQCSQCLIAKYEHDATAPTVGLAVAIAGVLSTTCEELVNGKGE